MASDAEGCAPMETLLRPYLDGQAPRDERGRVERHLASCLPCRRKLALLATLDRLLGAAARTPAAAGPPEDPPLRVRPARRDSHGWLRGGRYAPLELLRRRGRAAVAGGLALALGLALAPWPALRDQPVVREGASRLAAPRPPASASRQPLPALRPSLSLALASPGKGAVSFARLMAFFAARRDGEAAADFARDFLAEPELAALWDDYAEAGDEERLVAGLRSSRKFGKLLEKYASKPGLKDLAERTAAFFVLHPAGGPRQIETTGSGRGPLVASVPATRGRPRAAISASLGIQTARYGSPPQLSAFAALSSPASAPPLAVSPASGGGQDPWAPPPPQGQGSSLARQAEQDGRRPASLPGLAAWKNTPPAAPVPEPPAPGDGAPGPKPAAGGPTVTRYRAVRASWTDSDGSPVARRIVRKFGDCGGDDSAACAERDAAAYAGFSAQAKARLAGEGILFDAATPDQKRKVEAYAFCKSRLWQSVPAKFGCEGYP